MYTLLRDEKGLSETTVALLYTAAYGSAAATAFLAGWAADRFGRRAACLAFCAIHCIASASVLSDDVRVLAAGRLAAGVGITLLWTAFESWMVAEWNARVAALAADLKAAHPDDANVWTYSSSASFGAALDDPTVFTATASMKNLTEYCTEYQK